MTLFLGYLAGLATLPAIALLLLVYMVSVGKVGPVQTTSVIYGHQVDGDPSNLHEHEYNAWIPPFVQRRMFLRDAGRCVYAELGKMPGAVWDDEVAYIADLGTGVALSDDQWTAAETELKTRYDLCPVNPYAIIDSHSHLVDPIARAQLARLTNSKAVR